MNAEFIIQDYELRIHHSESIIQNYEFKIHNYFSIIHNSEVRIQKRHTKLTQNLKFLTATKWVEKNDLDASIGAFCTDFWRAIFIFSCLGVGVRGRGRGSPILIKNQP